MSAPGLTAPVLLLCVSGALCVLFHDDQNDDIVCRMMILVMT